MTIRRIVVGVGAGAPGAASLAAAAALAALHDAELEALFAAGDEVERLAALPFAREVCLASAAPRPLDAQSVARALQARVQEARRALSARTGRTDPRWSFRVASGSLVDALLAASAGADLLVVGNRPWDPAALPLARAASATLLVLPAGAPAIRGALAAVCSTEVAPERAVGILCTLASAVGDGLVVLLVDADGRALPWIEEAEGQLREAGREAAFRVLSRPAALRHALDHLDYGVLALVGAEAALGDEAVGALLAASRRPAFVCPA